MSNGLETVQVKLVTIIASFEFGDRIAANLRSLGVGGYTSTKADGWGSHGVREYGAIDGANVRFESLARPELARKILQFIEMNFADQAIVAFAQDVEVVPNRHFAASHPIQKS
jgi:hypothetical protein